MTIRNEITGVYKIQSKIHPDRIYIGSTINITNRIKQHLDLLRRNRHFNKKLQLHYDKYGETDLEFEIIKPHPPCELYSQRYSLGYGLKKEEHNHIVKLQPFFNMNNVMTDWENPAYQRKIYNSTLNSI